MSVRTRVKLEIVASLDSNEQQVQFSRPDSTLSSVIESFDVESSGELEIAAAEADYALPLGKVVTGQLLYIETTGDLTIKFDGEAVGHDLKGSSTVTAKLLFRTEFTSTPLITNNSSSAVAALSFFIAGSKT